MPAATRRRVANALCLCGSVAFFVSFVHFVTSCFRRSLRL